MSSLYLDKVKEIARGAGWQEIDLQENIKMISFFKDYIRVNVYYSKGTVASCLEHPVKGKTQLFRKNCNYKQLYAIFNNPRVHTGKGYYRRSS